MLQEEIPSSQSKYLWLVREWNTISLIVTQRATINIQI